jgi:outer membrane lipopolysaccharide assembly protein LptE/RlpB
VTLVEEGAEADGHLLVRGGEPRTGAAAIGPQGVATEYEVVLSADFRLERPEGGEAVRAARGLEVRRTYPYGDDVSPAVAETNKRRAARQAARELAGRLLGAVKSGF